MTRTCFCSPGGGFICTACLDAAEHGAALGPVHVYPLDDDPEHQMATVCWCRPRVEHVDPATGRAYDAPLVVHRDQAQRVAEAS